MIYNLGTGLSALGIDGLDEVLTVDPDSLSLGVRQPVPTHALDVGGELFADTVIALTYSNLPPNTAALFASNAAVFGCNTAVYASNAIQGSAPAVSGLAASFASNTAVWGSNSAVSASNSAVFASNAAVSASNAAVAASNTAVSASNTAVSASNSAIFGCNAAVSASNAAVWGSNAAWFASNTGVWGSSTAVWASNAGAFGCNAGAFGCNAGTDASNFARGLRIRVEDTPESNLTFSVGASNRVALLSNNGDFVLNGGALHGSNSLILRVTSNANTVTGLTVTAGGSLNAGGSVNVTAGNLSVTGGAVLGGTTTGLRLGVGQSNNLLNLTSNGNLRFNGGAAVFSNAALLQVWSNHGDLGGTHCNVLTASAFGNVTMGGSVFVPSGTLQVLNGNSIVGSAQQGLTFGVGASNGLAVLRSNGELWLNGAAAVLGSNALRLGVASNGFQSNDLLTLRANGDLEMGAAGQLIGSNFMLFGTRSDGVTTYSQLGLAPDGAVVAPTLTASHQLGHLYVTKPGFAGWGGGTVTSGGALVASTTLGTDLDVRSETVLAGQVACARLWSLFKEGGVWKKASLIVDDADGRVPWAAIKDVPDFALGSQLVGAALMGAGVGIIGALFAGAAGFYFAQKQASAAAGTTTVIREKTIIRSAPGQDGVEAGRGMTELVRGMFKNGRTSGVAQSGATRQYNNATYSQVPSYVDFDV